MKLFSDLLSYLSILFNFYVIFKCYQSLSKEKIKFKPWFILVMLPCSLATFLSNYFLVSSFKMFITLIAVFIELKIIFREKNYIVILKLLMIYMLLLACDFIISIVFLFFPINSVRDVGYISFIRCLNTLLESLLLLMFFLSKRIRLIINKIINFIVTNSNIFLLVLLFLLFAILIILTYLSSIKFTLMIFVITLALLIVFFFLCFLLIYQYFKNVSVEKEQKALLELMNEYERVLDNDRINRHEMLNNLIVLKSTKNKSSKEYSDLLDDLINSYQVKKSEFYTKLHNLPSGIKGIIYYKLGTINTEDINIKLFTNDKVKDAFESMDSKVHFKTCKIIGILIDNALEATITANNKLIIIDMYLEKDDIIVYIENSFNNTIDLNNICDKGISSKGKNRGYGLYIANKIIKDSENALEFKQYINELNNFVTILTVKNSSKN